MKVSSSSPRACERPLQSGLRALNIILTVAQNRHSLSMIDVVEVLRQCLTHGVELNATTSVSNPTALALGTATAQSMPSAAGQGSSRYRPPHARRQSSSSSGWWKLSIQVIMIGDSKLRLSIRSLVQACVLALVVLCPVHSWLCNFIDLDVATVHHWCCHAAA